MKEKRTPLSLRERVRPVLSKVEGVRGGALLLLFLFSTTVSAECVRLGGVKVNVEVAQTPNERAKGLMNRKSLPPNAGMWFVFDGPTTTTFWMRNTYVPLDLIFVGKDLRIVHIHQNARPLDETPIASPAPYWYVLEVPAGFANARHLKVGDILQYQKPKC